MGLLDNVDWEEYLRRYQDVANAGWDPQQHYIRHGQGENRELTYLQTGGLSPNEPSNTTPNYAQNNVQPLDADALDYLSRYQDVANEGWNPWNHYQAHGRAEGRTWGQQAPNYTPGSTGSNAPGLNQLLNQAFTQQPPPQTPAGTGGLEPNANRPNYLLGQLPGLLSGNTGAGSPEGDDYLRRYTDVAGEGWDPWQHYLQHGRAEGRTWNTLAGTGGLEPNDPRRPANEKEVFSPVRKAPKAYSSGVDPEKLAPNQVDSYWIPPDKWDPAKYLRDNPDLADDPWAMANPLAHYALYGRDEGRQWGTGGYKNTDFREAGGIYLGMYEDVEKEGWDPWTHYQKYGKAEGRKWYGDEWDDKSSYLLYTDKDFKPPKDWDAQKYLNDNPDLKNNRWAQENPLAHFALVGQGEGRGLVPGGTTGNAIFKNASRLYLYNNPEIEKSGMTPWEHYQKYGKAEGRKWQGEEWGEKTHLQYTDQDFIAPTGWDAKAYLAANPHLANNEWAQKNPLAHAALFGKDNPTEIFKGITPEGKAQGTEKYIGGVIANHTNYVEGLTSATNGGENPYSPTPQTERGTLLAHNEGMFNPIDENGYLKSAKAAGAESIKNENIAAIVSLGGGSNRVYFNDGTHSDLRPGELEVGIIGRTRVTGPEGDFYRIHYKDGTTKDTPLENKPSGLARFAANTGEWLHSAMPVIIPAAGLAAITAGAGGVIGAAYGGATGAAGGAAAGGSMSTGVGEGLMSGAMGSATAGGSAAGAGAGAATGTATGGATGTATGASTTPWYLSQPMVQSYTTAGLQTGVGMMQGKSFGEAVTQGVISGALSYAGGYIVDGMGNSIGAVANNPAASKAIVTGLLSTASSKIQGAEWEDALLNGLTTGTLSYIGGKLSGWLTSPSGEEVNAEELFSSKGPPPAEYTRQQLPPSSSAFTGLGENLEYGGTPAPPWQPQGFGGYGGESLGNYGFPSTPGLSAGELTQGLSYKSPLSVPGYESPFMSNRYFNPINPYTGEPYENPNEFKFPGLETYYNSQNPWNMNNALTEGLTYASPTLEWINPIERFGGEDPFGNRAFINSLTYGKPNLFNTPYKSPLEGTMFGPQGGLLNYGYPGIQNPGPGMSVGGITPTSTKINIGEVIKTILTTIPPGGPNGPPGGPKGPGGGEGSAKGGLLSLDEMPIPEYLKRKLKKKAKAAGKSWREYLADATQGQKSYYSHLA